MKNYILSLLTALFSAIPAVVYAEVAVPGQWRLHNSFDYFFQETVDTPDRVYLLALGQIKANWGDDLGWNKTHGQLFVIDKASGEVTGYNANNYLNGNVISDIAYNAAKGYLLIIYDNYNIDVLLDDDTVYAIPGLSSSNLSVSKNINSVTFDPQHNKAYLATDFGYLVIDDTQYVISESRVYNERIDGIARVGEHLLIGRADGLSISPIADRHTNLDSFTPVSGAADAVSGIIPLSDTQFGFITAGGLNIGTIAADGSVSTELKASGTVYSFSENKEGYYVRGYGRSYQLSRQGSVNKVYTDKLPYGNVESGSWDMKDFYFPVSRKGVARQTYLGNHQWSEEPQLYVPNAPQPFAAGGFTYSSLTGMIAGNDSYNRFFRDWGMDYEALESGYKSGVWTQITSAAPAEMYKYANNSHLPIVDPIDENYMWFGTLKSGLIRVDLRDNNLEYFTHPKHATQSQSWSHAVFPLSSSWAELCHVSSPSFDREGNLWCTFNPSHTGQAEPQPLYCWKAADRKAGTVSAFKNVPVKGYTNYYDNIICTAGKTEASRNFVIFGPSWSYAAPLYLFYHAGTLDDTSDDKLYSYNKFIDQDGNSISYVYFNVFYEDPSTGYIWVGSDTGLFYFNPNDALRAGDTDGALHVRRVKVARNDGTNLADYLLNGYDVTCIASDGAGRKWFGTAGSGITVSSADGSQIIEQFTTANSMLPSDIIYGLGFDPTGNAVWIGTSEQICTYYCDAAPAEQDYSKVLAFPNPVRPEYQGPVTIQGLADNSLVKIVDASGAVVKELGLSNGGMILWDLTDMNGNDVSAGVYYIFASTSAEADPASGHTSKILVVR